MIRRLKKFLIIIASLYALIFIGLYFLQEKMIFMPESLPQDYSYSFPENFDEINLRTPDGAILNALHFKAENPKGVVLYFHGNAGELSRWGMIVQKFVELQYDVLVMDYRTYGKSTGKLSQKALYNDAQLFYDELLKNYREDEIVVYGRSLGTTFATYVAAKNHPKQLILEAPFYSLNELASERFPIYPVSWFLKFNFPTYQYLKEVSCPVTIFHGTDDLVVNYENSEKLSKIPTKGKLNFISIPEGTHHNLGNHEVYKRTLDKIL
ncbi:alpha/beta hydrolase [Aequorivita antarctica]|uniref:Lysophospholipase n=1 Tax=Aequorivita antarctica TaxID=153266 RepID=A0A5C6Z310_9FLAO|nr:alpha/beta fold hydrolase [Aequorivita antarctica]TXD74245.1 lysophospholipase [Aequorivita antarctica]SRX73583.1 2-succinyl-6-hydroxy-2, 4-cyclohexadiene-1-carboxylate synthase [Aequorivita antarctica]